MGWEWSEKICFPIQRWHLEEEDFIACLTVLEEAEKGVRKLCLKQHLQRFWSPCFYTRTFPVCAPTQEDNRARRKLLVEKRTYTAQHRWDANGAQLPLGWQPRRAQAPQQRVSWFIGLCPSQQTLPLFPRLKLHTFFFLNLSPPTLHTLNCLSHGGGDKKTSKHRPAPK